MTTKILVDEWRAKAEEDWLVAKTLVHEGIAYGAACFHAQQVAEKYLKTFLTANGKIPPRSHDLLELLEACRSLDTEFSELAQDAAFLTTFYIEVRYPGGDTRVFSHKTTVEAVDAAGKFRELVSQKLRMQK